MPNTFVLEWSASRVRLRSVPAGEVVEVAIPSLTRGARHDLALFDSPQPCVRVPGGDRTPFLVGRSLEAAPPVPGAGALSTAGCRAHLDGTLTALDGGTLWIRTPQGAGWASRRVPDGFTARDVSLGAGGAVYVCGSASGRAAVTRIEGDRVSAIVPVVAAKAQRGLAALGADETFWRIDAAAEPLLVTASCAWLLENDTDFAVVRWGDRWTVRTSERDAIRAWHRAAPSGLSLYTVKGLHHFTTDAGSSWTVRDLAPAIRAAWEGRGSLVVRAARARGRGELLLCVTRYDWSAPEPRQLLGSTALASVDGGATFEVLVATDGPDHEIVDALWDEPRQPSGGRSLRRPAP